MRPHAIDQICEFILQHMQACRSWGIGKLQDWVLWHVEHGYCRIVYNNGTIEAAAFARPVRSVKMGKRACVHDTRGKICWTDMLIAPNPDSLPYVFQLLENKSFKHCKKLAFRREKHHQRVSVHSLERILPKLASV